jgi:hypothetical protein
LGRSRAGDSRTTDNGQQCGEAGACNLTPSSVGTAMRFNLPTIAGDAPATSWSALTTGRARISGHIEHARRVAGDQNRRGEIELSKRRSSIA